MAAKFTTTLSRRSAITTAGAGAVAACLPAVASAAQLGPNDRRLEALCAEAFDVQDRMSRALDAADRRWGTDIDQTPLAGYMDRLFERQNAYLTGLAKTPADSVRGAGAKLRATRFIRDQHIGDCFQAVECAAMDDVERLALEAASA